MHERQARDLSEFRDKVRAGQDLAVVFALRAWLAEREPVPYTLSPSAEALLSEASPQPQQRTAAGPFRRFLTKVGQAVCTVIDETLYGDLLSAGRAHQAEIDRIQAEAADRETASP